MNRRSLIALIMVIIIMFSFSSCSLVKKDPEVDKKTAIVEILGDTITKEEVKKAYDEELMMQSYYYQYQTGQELDTKSKDVINAINDMAINNLIRNKVIEKKIIEFGFNSFTEDEEKSFNDKANEAYKSSLEQIKTSYFADTKLTGDELDLAIESKAKELGFPGVESLVSNNKKETENNLLRDNIVKDILVSDDEIKSDYDVKVAKAKENYAANLSSYGSDVLNNKTIYYVPSGYRFVKQILIKLSDDDNKEITNLNTQVSSKQQQIDTINDSLKKLDENKEEDKEQIDSLKKSLDQYNLELTELKLNLDKLKDDAFIKLDPKVNELKLKLEEGGDFDLLMEEYGEDPGMKNSPTKETGYPVCKGFTNFDPQFTNAAMELKNINDVSPSVKGSYGYYVIKYFSDAVEGEVPLDSLKEQIKTELLSTKQNQAFDTQISEWIKDANAKIFKDRLN